MCVCVWDSFENFSLIRTLSILPFWFISTFLYSQFKKKIHKTNWRIRPNMTTTFGFRRKLDFIVESLGWGKHLTLNRTEAGNEKSLRWLMLMVNVLVCQVKFKPSYNFCVTLFQFNPLSPLVCQGKPLTALKWRFIYVIKTGQISTNYHEIILFTDFFFNLNWN